MKIFDYIETTCEINTQKWEEKSGICFDPDSYEGEERWDIWYLNMVEELTGHLNGACNNL